MSPCISGLSSQESLLANNVQYMSAYFFASAYDHDADVVGQAKLPWSLCTELNMHKGCYRLCLYVIYTVHCRSTQPV